MTVRISIGCVAVLLMPSTPLEAADFSGPAISILDDDTVEG